MNQKAEKKLNILLLEDDDALAHALVKAMQKRGHAISRVSDSAGLRAASNGQSFDLVLMDLKLENESSLAYIAETRAAHPAARIIMITGYASIATTVEAMRQGADDYLPKPVSADDILRAYLGSNSTAGLSEEILSPKRLEWEHIQRVLQDNSGNISKTAEQLNMHRRTLQRKLQKKPQQ